MSSIGPDLPPHLLAKRKREAEGEQTAAKLVESPTSKSPARSPDGAEKRRRVMGPAAPPAPLNERPSISAQVEDDSDSSDDDFGPAMPSANAPKIDYDEIARQEARKQREKADKEPTIKRDDWMMLPPTQDGLAKNLDPTKIRPGRFRSGKGAAAPSGGGIDAMWTETAEEKRKRLENAVLGIAPPPSAKSASSSGKSKQDEEAARRIKEYNERHRSRTLVEQHEGRKDVEKEDDPSKRAFDREKDVGLGVKIGHSQKKEMLDRAANFGSKFAGGKYL